MPPPGPVGASPPPDIALAVAAWRRLDDDDDDDIFSPIEEVGAMTDVRTGRKSEVTRHA